MNFEERKMVIFMIFFTLNWVSGTKGYIADTIFEAAKPLIDLQIHRFHCECPDYMKLDNLNGNNCFFPTVEPIPGQLRQYAPKIILVETFDR